MASDITILSIATAAPWEQLPEIDAEPLLVFLQRESPPEDLLFELLHVQGSPGDDDGIVAFEGLPQMADNFPVPPVEDVVHDHLIHVRGDVILGTGVDGQKPLHEGGARTQLLPDGVEKEDSGRTKDSHVHIGPEDIGRPRLILFPRAPTPDLRGLQRFLPDEPSPEKHRVLGGQPQETGNSPVILPALDRHPVKRVHSLTEVINGERNKTGYISQTAFTAVQG